jgi:hypothetical protein
MTAAELRDIMHKHGWTQVYLAEVLPVKSTRIIQYWLTGETKIRELVAHRIRSLAAEAGRRK